MTDTPSRPAPQQEQAAPVELRFVVDRDAFITDKVALRVMCVHHAGRAKESDLAYARAIAAALNASPPKEAM
jgi:hypothetical protein